MKLSTLFAAASLAVITNVAQAQVEIKDPWVRATVPQQKATGAFMQLTATADSRLVAASSPLTPVVEVHEMAMHDNVMKMRQIPAVALPAGQPVELKPGSYHIMLMNLTQQVREGETVPLKLVFEDSQGQRKTVDVAAVVRSLSAVARGAHKH